MTNGNSAERFSEWAADYGFTDEQTDVHQYALRVARDAWDKAMSVCADGGKDSSDARDVRDEESDVRPKERLCGGSHIACNGVDYCLGHPSCRDIAKERAEKDKK